MRKLLVLMFPALLFASCSSSQKAEEKAVAKCLGTEASTVFAILEGSGSTSQKLAAIAPEVWACAQAASVSPAVAGSSK